MADVKIEIKISDDLQKEINKAFSILKEKNFRGMMSKIGDAMLNTTKERFKLKEGPDGTPWPDYSDATIAFRKKTGNKNIKRQNLLRGNTASLLNELKKEVGDDFVEWGSDLEYAAVHQFGYEENKFFGKGSAPIPARPYLGFSKDDEIEIVEQVDKFLKRELG